MKKIILYLQFILFPAICFAQRSIVSYPYADSANSETFLFGSQADQGNHQFQYSILDIYHAMVPYLDTTSGANIYNSDGRLTGNRILKGAKKTLTLDSVGSFAINDTITGIAILNLGAGGNGMINADPTLNRININTHGNSGFCNVPTLVTYADTVAQTATVTLVNYVTTKTGVYQINSYGNVTAVSSATITIAVAFTDTHSGAQSLNVGSASVTGYLFDGTYTFRAKSGTHIIVTATVAGSSITYDAGVQLFQLY